MANLKPSLFLIIAMVVASLEFNHTRWQQSMSSAIPSAGQCHKMPVSILCEVTKEAYDTCDTQNLISIQTTSPARFTINNVDNHYYICTVGLHCKSFLKLAIRVSVPNNSSAMLSH
ncbi:unnamed protein product [Lactuca virosa]|uniref:Phytocyanin domain-containing protein n=1 Tax=Lactuca virosa TaxID=75947 RepID=A0AAU9LM91_9ASTR|nr:unnamed protein product [Lactuca virosa]